MFCRRFLAAPIRLPYFMQIRTYIIAVSSSELDTGLVRIKKRGPFALFERLSFSKYISNAIGKRIP